MKWDFEESHHEGHLATKADEASFSINYGVSLYNGDEKFIRLRGESSSMDLKTNLTGSVFSLGAKVIKTFI